MNKILLIEDEYEIQQSIKSFLETEGYHVIATSTAEDGMMHFNSETFDLILLDMMLPKMQGETFLKYIRTQSEVPIIVISALSDELVQFDAFENRIDDYVVKPFSMNILNYKIKAVLRRINQEPKDVIKYGDLSLHIDNYFVTYKDKELDLTAKEFEILQLLITNQGRVYSREEILTLIWGYDYFGDARNIDVHIKNLRKKIEIDCIRTIKGVGYRIDKEGR